MPTEDTTPETPETPATAQDGAREPVPNPVPQPQPQPVDIEALLAAERARLQADLDQRIEQARAVGDAHPQPARDTAAGRVQVGRGHRIDAQAWHAHTYDVDHAALRRCAGVAATAPSRAHRSHRRSREAGVSRAP